MHVVVTRMVETAAWGSTEYASLGGMAWFSKFIPGYKQNFINYVSIHLTAAVETPSGGIANAVTALFLDAHSTAHTKAYRGIETHTRDALDLILFHEQFISFIPPILVTSFGMLHVAITFTSNYTASVKRWNNVAPYLTSLP